MVSPLANRHKAYLPQVSRLDSHKINQPLRNPQVGQTHSSPQDLPLAPQITHLLLLGESLEQTH